MERQARKESMLIPVMVILMTMYIITGILLLLLAFLMYKVDLTEPVVNGAIIAIYIIAGFFGGFLIGKKTGVKKYLWGLFMGALYYGVLILVGLILHQGLSGEPVHLLSTMVLCLLSATAGGMIS